ncbi:hypothetical protein [Streptomyces sp. A30]|uniref:hypothetical protein n=1 Tax=Streptomyces sp. A30 TaxID=2789273 RepID=UPI00397F7294
MIRRYFTDLSRFEVVIVTVVVCLAVVGIGRAVWPDSDRDGSPAPSTTATVKKLPVVVDSEDPALVDIDSERSEMGLPPASGDAPLTERVLDEIQEKTLVMAGIRAKVSAGCEGGQVTPKAGHKTLCTVTYQGVKLTWDVWVADVTGSGIVQLTRYNIYPPDSGVLLAKAVYGRFWDEHHKTAKELRCDRIPPLKTVTLGDDTGYECQYLDADDGSPRWVREKVFLETVGPVFGEIE